MPEVLQVAQITSNLQPTHREWPSSVRAHVGMVCDSLGDLGHDVTLYGHEQSETTAELVGVAAPGPEVRGEAQLDTAVSKVIDAALCDARSGMFDIAHSHMQLNAFSLPKLRELNNYVTTLSVIHHDPAMRALKLIGDYPELPFVAFSHSQAEHLDLNWIGVVHHGIDTNVLVPNDAPSENDSALVIGMIKPQKGTHSAVGSALHAGLSVNIAGPIGDSAYFETCIEPLLENPAVEYLGNLCMKDKRAAFAEATVTVSASTLSETFCLVLAESMSCGTPAVALASGACSEVVDQGISGFTVDDVVDLPEAIQKATLLDPTLIRETAEQRFSLERMARDYTELYQKYAR